MAATNFNTENNTYRKLMGNGLTYHIPRFQRDYSWTESEWEDLWLDILDTIKPDGEPAHYMGYLVLQSANEKVFDVIDGQQRITTLSLIVLAALKNIKELVDNGIDPERNAQRLEQMRQSYIGYLDPVTLVPRSKLTLNRNNDHYYQTYIVPLNNLPTYGFRSSEHLLRKAFNWFEKKISEYVRREGGDSGVVLARLIETMSDRLFFTVINVTDELNAFKVFETLNARGVRLSATDLLKNYLFSVLSKENQHDHEIKVLEDRWETMVGRLGSESFPDFLRFHWLSRHTFVRQTELFKVVRNQIRNREKVFLLLTGMEEDIDTYLALSKPDASDWARDCKKYANILRMFNVKQPYSLIMAARRAFSGEDFEDLLKACVTISFRYNVIGSLPANEQERVYYSVAQKIAKKDIISLSQALPLMSSIYPSDNSFQNDFAEKIIKTVISRNNRIVRYILCEIERTYSGQALDFNSDKFNVEHILPQHPDERWSDFSEAEVEALVYRLGNMTLMSTSANNNLGDETYSVKRPEYEKSAFKITQKIAEEHAVWTPERIAGRQSWMANQAKSIWRIAQLS